MTEPFANEALSAYLDGELSEVEVARLERELQSNPALRAELDHLREVADLFRTHGPVRAPLDFQRKVLLAVADEPMPGGIWRFLRRPFGIPIEGIAVTAAAAAVLVLALDLGGGEPGPERAATGKDAAVPAAPAAAEKGSAPETYTEEPAIADAWEEPESQETAKERATPRSSEEASKEALEEAPAPTGSGDKKSTLLKSLSTRGAGEAEPVQDLGGEPDASDAQQPAEQAPSGTAEKAPSRDLVGVQRGFRITTGDADALVALHRIVGRYKGRLVDQDGRTIGAEALEPGTSTILYVQIEDGYLMQFGDAVRELGSVTEYPVESDRLYSQSVVRVELVLPAAAQGTTTDRPATK